MSVEAGVWGSEAGIRPQLTGYYTIVASLASLASLPAQYSAGLQGGGDRTASLEVAASVAGRRAGHWCDAAHWSGGPPPVHWAHPPVRLREGAATLPVSS